MRVLEADALEDGLQFDGGVREEAADFFGGFVIDLHSSRTRSLALGAGDLGESWFALVADGLTAGGHKQLPEGRRHANIAMNP